MLFSFSSKYNSLIFRKAFLKGSKEVICDPIWVEIPKISIADKFFAILYSSNESSISIPNLSPFLPVDIFSWVQASIFGLILIAILAILPSFLATLLKR